MQQTPNYAPTENIVLASLYHTYRTVAYRLVLQVVVRAVFKPQRAMGLGILLSLVLSAQVNLLCKDANKFTQFFLFQKAAQVNLLCKDANKFTQFFLFEKVHSLGKLHACSPTLVGHG